MSGLNNKVFLINTESSTWSLLGITRGRIKRSQTDNRMSGQGAFLHSGGCSPNFRIDLLVNIHFAYSDLSPQQTQFAFCVCLCAHLGRPVPQTVHRHSCAVVCVSHVDDRLSDGLDHLLLTSQQTPTKEKKHVTVSTKVTCLFCFYEALIS